jgi:HK97 gp10 family phage protein
MTTRVEVDKVKLERVIRESPNRAHDLVFTLLHDAEAYAKENMGRAGSPAPAGEFPGIVTGVLKNSLTVEPVSQLSGALITDNVDYAVYLELGTSKMQARPFMQPTAAWMEGEIPRRFREFIE